MSAKVTEKVPSDATEEVASDQTVEVSNEKTKEVSSEETVEVSNEETEGCTVILKEDQIMSGLSFESKEAAVNSLRNFFSTNYHPFVVVSNA